MSETTSFVYAEGSLIPVEDAREVELKKQEIRREFSERKLSPDEKWMNIPDAIRAREFPMFLTITNYTLEKVIDYLLLKSEEHKSSHTTTTYSANNSKEFFYKDLARDLPNSSVFQRLLSGKPLLKTAPPLSYFHNWYELVDDGEAVCIDVTFTPTTAWKNGQSEEKTTIRIDGEEWKNLGQDESDGTYIVQWKETEYIYKLSRMDEADFERLIHPHMRKLVTKDGFHWKLTRLEKDE